MLVFVFYVPKSHKEEVKEAVFKLGAGEIGNYSKCSFESVGMGQFIPKEGSKPFVGEIYKLERVEEVKIEMVVKKELKNKVLEAFLKVHPYEEPAYHFIESL